MEKGSAFGLGQDSETRHGELACRRATSYPTLPHTSLQCAAAAVNALHLWGADENDYEDGDENDEEAGKEDNLDDELDFDKMQKDLDKDDKKN